ncbi:RNA polymerase sigma factor [Treponema pectinovorum]|uniref:RNA polymerase sigma factor n=1 Tax=Treponema pectinovorum TaxID=164 RepID=UPI0011C6FF79|nr:sigma-70 family RNA polymerase sigma factor [Treponema pectinovorum]
MQNKTLSNIEKLLINKRDEILIKATLRGDSKSFEHLISYYKKRICALGMSFFRNLDDTDDFMQEVFVKVYMNLSSFKFTSSFGTWITKIAYNAAVNSITRRQEYAPLADEELIVAKDLTPEDAEIKKITLEAIREGISLLPENFGACVEMYFFHGLKYSEISEITGFPVNTVKSHMFRAKKLLAERLKGVL